MANWAFRETGKDFVEESLTDRRKNRSKKTNAIVYKLSQNNVDTRNVPSYIMNAYKSTKGEY
jgi:hypothetical protein